MKNLKKAGLAFTLMISCLCSAAVTVLFLTYVGRTARIRVENQYTEPDYVRYIGQGYAFDTVSDKTNLLLTVTDGDLPVRVHIMTVDTDKNTLDILDIPPDSFIIADGFTGTVREAYSTPVYREIISRALCLNIDGCMSLDNESAGGVGKLLGLNISYEKGKRIASGGFAYSKGDEDSVFEYHEYLAKILDKIYGLGPAETFTKLMNLIANRFDTDMTVEKMLNALSGLCEVKPKKMNIRIARGCPAKFGDGLIWCLDPVLVAEQLNEYFRVKDTVYLPEALGIPKTAAGGYPFGDLKEKVSDII